MNLIHFKGMKFKVDLVLICTDATGPEEKDEEQNQERAGEELRYD